ncbi:MAG: 16S rRNA (adenine(1518)-N(6)/adenine(1519)-N(6))-dimethyltransferase RsmA [Clostridiales bacterium]|nr:16S rRNA (adenine(1518)-N(6)/adenine(1519)-N(6))-dimethyltransferase RsmA [Clostridiales bacterium]
MKSLSDIGVIKEILYRHGFSLTKSLGQNFLIDPDICPEMARASGAQKGVGVLEIGPGIGVLTAELAKLAEKVVTVELDARLLPILGETLADFDNVEVVQGDILKLDLPRLIEEKFAGLRVVVCANLPYYITSPVIMLLLESRLPLEMITVMVQKEAGERLCATVGSRKAGAVTVAVDYFAQAEILFEVSRTSFVPAPKVDSFVIQLDVRSEPPITVQNEAGFFRMVKAAFGQRRKTAANAISAGMVMDKATIAAAIERAGFDPNVRAESLSMEELARLSCEIERG